MSNHTQPYSFLIVDNDPDDRLFVHNALNKHLHHPNLIETDCFSEVKSYLSDPETQFHAVLLDPTLPNYSGEVFVRDMLTLCAGIPIIILTKNIDPSFKATSYRLGISDYLIKENLTSSELYRSVLYNVEHRKTLTDLKDSEKRYTDLFHLSPLPMFVIDVESLFFLDVNNAAINYYGYSEAEFQSMTIKDISPEGDMNKFDELIETNDLSQPITITTHHQKKSGEFIYVEIQTNPIVFKGKNANILLANDITDQVKFIQTIQKQNDKLKSIAWIQSHIVRAPLARMMGLIDMLKEDIPTDIDEKELLGYLLDSARELDKIIHDISEKAEEVDYNIEKARNV